MLGDLAPDSVLNIDASDSAVWVRASFFVFQALVPTTLSHLSFRMHKICAVHRRRAAIPSGAWANHTFQTEVFVGARNTRTAGLFPTHSTSLLTYF